MPPTNKRGWDDMTAEERSQEMRRRMAHREPKRRAAAEAATPSVVTLQALVENLERQQAEFDATLRQLKQMLG